MSISAIDPSLRKYAIRNWSEVQPGRKYALVHSGGTLEPSSEIVWVTGKGVSGDIYEEGSVGELIFWYTAERQYSFMDKGYVTRRYASDTGIFDVASYRNDTNYMLDVEAIRKYTGLTVINEKEHDMITLRTLRTPLPEYMVEDDRKIVDMKIGDSGYTTHWAMSIDRDRFGYLNPNYRVEDRPFGTLSMRVTRLASGYEVVALSSEKYDISDSIDPSWLEVKTIRVTQSPR